MTFLLTLPPGRLIGSQQNVQSGFLVAARNLVSDSQNSLAAHNSSAPVLIGVIASVAVLVVGGAWISRRKCQRANDAHPAHALRLEWDASLD